MGGLSILWGNLITPQKPSIWKQPLKAFVKIGVPKKLATEATIFSNSYFQRKPLTGCYCILPKRLETEPPVFENIANHSADFTKNAQSRTYFKCIFNSNILWNLEFAIFDFIRQTTLVYSVRFPYSSLMRAKQNKICLL